MRDINSLNKVLLIGNLGQKPEVRYMQQGRARASFSLATKERLTNPTTNETKDRTEWHRIVVWGKLAEFVEKYLTVGKQVYVEGKLRTRQWQDKEGTNRKITEVEAQTIILLGRRDASGEEETIRTGPAVQDFPVDESGSDLPAGGGDEEVPF